MWSAAGLEHIRDKRFQGLRADPTVEVRALDQFTLQLFVQTERIVDVRFATARCLVAIACANYAAGWALGKRPAELGQLGPADILRAVGPFPAHKAVWATRVCEALLQARVRLAATC